MPTRYGYGLDISVHGSGGTPPATATLDLDGGEASYNYSGSFTEGGAAVVLSSSPALTVKTTVTELVITITGAQDTVDETMSIGTEPTAGTRLDQDWDVEEVFGATTFYFDYLEDFIATGGGVITVTNSVGGTMPVADFLTMLAAIKYNHGGTGITSGDPVFQFAPDAVAPRTATIAVSASGPTPDYFVTDAHDLIMPGMSVLSEGHNSWLS